jgi:hypothetical protein
VPSTDERGRDALLKDLEEPPPYARLRWSRASSARPGDLRAVSSFVPPALRRQFASDRRARDGPSEEEIRSWRALRPVGLTRAPLPTPTARPAAMR